MKYIKPFLAALFILAFLFPININAAAGNCFCWGTGSSDCAASNYYACSNAPKCCEFSIDCDPNPPCPTAYINNTKTIVSCSPGNNGNYSGIITAIGCLDVFSSPQAPITTILQLSVRLSAGAALILFSFAGIQMVLSSGDPKKYQASKEMVTAVIGGLIFIALSLVLLNFLGATVLQLGPMGFKIT